MRRRLSGYKRMTYSRLYSQDERAPQLDTHSKMATILAMPPTLPFEIVFDELAIEHLDSVENKHLSLIRNAIQTRLRFEPNIETRNRKPLREPTTIGATWELRCGPNNRFRIFYDVHPEARIVVVLAIAVKVRDQLWIGKERFQL